MLEVGVSFSDTITLGAIVVGLLVLVVAGLPVRLISTLRAERDEWTRIATACQEKLGAIESELATLRERTDMQPLLARIERLVESVESHSSRSADRHSDFAQTLAAQAKLVEGLVGEVHRQTGLLERIAEHGE